MDVNFKHTAAGSPEPVIFEKVLADKPGGGIIPNPAFDIPTGTVVGLDALGALKPIKAYRLQKAVAIIDTEIEIDKGSGVAVGDIIAAGKVGVAVTEVDATDATKDVVTVTLGVVVANGKVLHQAAEASADAAVAIVTPKFVTGAKVIANKGDQAIRLVVAATVRKETINASTEVLALLPNIIAV